jgi:hypothetical protein
MIIFPNIEKTIHKQPNARIVRNRIGLLGRIAYAAEYLWQASPPCGNTSLTDQI